MALNKFKKAQRQLAVQHRVEELQSTHKGFSKRKLNSMARQWVQHHYGSKATLERG